MDDNLALPPETPLDPTPRAVVVGASSGIGAALAHRLAQEGYVVALLARREEALLRQCKLINEEVEENRAFPFVHDVLDTDKIPLLFQSLLRELRKIDLFIYCTGITLAVDLAEYSLEKDHAMLKTNLAGGVAWLGQAANLFDRMGAGHIVGISSVAGDRGRVRNPAYNASKAGLDAYLEGLRNRLSKKGVTVLTVKPGFVDTAQLKSAARTFWVISPDQAAEDTWQAIRKRKQLIYTPARWRWMMLAIRHTPSFLFRRLSF